jgi:hypothetical protein
MQCERRCTADMIAPRETCITKESSATDIDLGISWGNKHGDRDGGYINSHNKRVPRKASRSLEENCSEPFKRHFWRELSASPPSSLPMLWGNTAEKASWRYDASTKQSIYARSAFDRPTLDLARSRHQRDQSAGQPCLLPLH